MSAWVLVIMVFGTGIAVDHVDFLTKQSCENAISVVKDHGSLGTVAFCIERPNK